MFPGYGRNKKVISKSNKWVIGKSNKLFAPYSIYNYAQTVLQSGCQWWPKTRKGLFRAVLLLRFGSAQQCSRKIV